jgi:hypothetical protein
MSEILALIEACGPVMGLLLFIIMKQIQIGNIKPVLTSIEGKVDLVLERVAHDDSVKPDDSGSPVPTEETVRG